MGREGGKMKGDGGRRGREGREGDGGRRGREGREGDGHWTKKRLYYV